MTTTTATTSAPLLAGLADLLAKAHRPLQPAMFDRIAARDRQRALADLQALPDAPETSCTGWGVARADELGMSDRSTDRHHPA